ncbi:hypothetical protein PMAYCL1PPCAC_15907, partial [Pristionchus mayeri]
SSNARREDQFGSPLAECPSRNTFARYPTARCLVHLWTGSYRRAPSTLRYRPKGIKRYRNRRSRESRCFHHRLRYGCARRGMPVFAGCLTQEGADALGAAADVLPGSIDTIIVNVASDASVAAAAKYLDEATKKYGGLHAIVNNAGIVGATFFDDLLNVEQYRQVVDVNTFGVIRVTQALKHLVKRTRGRIVTVSSAAARLGVIGMGPYTVSKFAVSGYCEVIRQELRYFGVSVHILEPGIFKTPMSAECNIKSRLDKMWSDAPTSTKNEYGECFFRRCRAQLSKSMGIYSSSRVDIVVDAYFHAITAKFPNLRYQLGLDCQFVMLPMSYLPTGLRDALFTVGEWLFKMPVPQCALQPSLGLEMVKI